MDKIKGVITGDIIGSSDIQIKYRDFLLESIRKIVDELSIIEPIKIELFRGDSFQMIIDAPEKCDKDCSFVTCRTEKPYAKGM